jgi:twitching motility protein PilT
VGREGRTGNPETATSDRHLRRRASDRPFGPFATEAEAREAIERLLRLQVERGAADLHLRTGEPPILRLGGDMVRLTDEPVLEDSTVGGMLWAIMPEKNKGEFDEAWDTDFAYEICRGLSLSRERAARSERRGLRHPHDRIGHRDGRADGNHA